MQLLDQLKSRVEAYRLFIVNEDPFNRAILKGTAKPEEIEQFLVDVHYLIKHTPIHLQLAIEYSKHEPELQAYFKAKYFEEQGHDQWALDDLAKLSPCIKGKDRPSTERVNDAMRDLVLHIERLIRKDPFLYLPYIFFAEYLVVIYGPEMTHGVAVTCGYGADAFSVIENHAELDRDHVHEWENIIATIVDERRYSRPFLEAMDQTICLHKLFFRACSGKVRHEAA